MSKKKDPSQRLGHSTIKKQDEAGLELTPSDANDSSGYCPDTNPDKITPHKKIRRARVKTVGKKDSHSLYKKQDKIYPKRVNGFFSVCEMGSFNRHASCLLHHPLDKMGERGRLP